MTPQETNSGKQVARESGFYLLGSILSRALGFIMLPIYSRCLTTAEYGTVELAELATNIVGIIFGMNVFGAAMTRLYQDCQTERAKNAVISTAVFADLALGGAAVALAIALSSPLSALVFKSSSYSGLLAAMFVSMFFGITVEVCLVSVRLKRQARFFMCYSLAALLATVCLNILFLVHLHEGVWGFVLSKLIVMSAGGGLLLWLTLRDAGLHFDSSICRRLAKFGAPLTFGNISLFFVHFGDRFFLGRLAGLAEVGSYSLAYRFGMLITTFVGEPFQRAWSVRYCAVLSEPQAAEKIRSVSKVFAACLLCGALSIALFSSDMITFMAPAFYAAACSTIPLVVLSYLLRDFADFFRNFLFVAHRSKLVSAITVGTGLLNCALNALLIKPYGVMGAAVATLGTWVCYWIVMYVLSQRQARMTFPLMTYFVQFLMASSACLLGLLFAHTGVLIRVSAKAAILVACICLMFRYSGFTVGERHTVLGLARALAGDLRNWRPRRVPAPELATNAGEL